MAELEQRCALGDRASVDAQDLRRHYVEDPAQQMSWQSRFDSDRSDWDDDQADDDDFDDYQAQKPYVRSTLKIGRNDPYICGSGKKYKKCCMQADEIRTTDLAVRQ